MAMKLLIAVQFVGGHATQTPDNVQRVNMVLENRCVTVKDISVQLGIGETIVCRILKRLNLRKVCAVWVPSMLTDARKETRKTAVHYWHCMRIVRGVET
jgi:hypothetical protein